ncbi:putative carrier protein [Cryptosporidium serpentis]
MTSNVDDWEVWSGDIPFWKHAIAGSAAGVVEHTSIFPLDTIKTILQADHLKKRSAIYDAVNYIKLRGVSSLFRGFKAAIIGNVPAHAAMFSTYELCRRTFSTKNLEVSEGNYRYIDIFDKLIAPALCGGTAVFVHDSIVTPMDVVKQRLQLGSYKNIFDCIKHMVKSEGPMSLFRSLPVTLFMNIPQNGLFVVLNENINKHFSHRVLNNRDPILKYFIFAGISGAIAGFITTPLDVVKTKIQTQACHIQNNLTKDIAYKGITETIKKTWCYEGYRGLYRGALSRATLIAPSYALCWGTYRTVKNVLST